MRTVATLITLAFALGAASTAGAADDITQLISRADGVSGAKGNGFAPTISGDGSSRSPPS